MSYLRFQHVFVGLMGLSALSAFAIPAKYTHRVEPNLQGLFAPVARPVGWVARRVRSRLAPEASLDRRRIEDVRRENEVLRVELANRTMQLEDVRERYAEKMKMGPIAQWCTPCFVVGPDSGSRESLNLSGSTLEGVREEMYVVYRGGMVGQVERAGVAGSQVCLITDPSFRIRASFGMFRPGPSGEIQFERVAAPNTVLEGWGKGVMMARTLPMRTLKDSRLVGAGGEIDTDMRAIVDDPDCPPCLKGLVLGRVTRVTSRRDAPLLAEIRVEPTETLTKLSEVMVVTKLK